MSEVVLVVDDDPVQRRLIENMVQRFGYRPVTAAGGDEAVALLTGPEAQPIDCVILDMVMPDLDGLGVLARMRDAGLAIPVIVQTAHGGLDNVVSAMRAGATDFVVKPASAERLQVSLRNALAGKALAGELQRIKRSRDGTLTFNDVITRAPRMKAALAGATKAAGSDIPVLIEGESGVGKELIARAISSLPTPDSPSISTGMSEPAAFVAPASAAFMRGARVMTSLNVSVPSRLRLMRWSSPASALPASALRKDTWRRSALAGFTTKSVAPARIAETTLSRPPCAVCTMTGIARPASRMRASTPRPSRSGITMSRMTQSIGCASGPVSRATASSPPAAVTGR